MNAGRVLLADDDRDIRELVAFKLTSAGYDVLATEDGTSALAAASQGPFAAIVLDVMMPGLTGIEVCRRLRRLPETAGVPVLLLTAKAQEGDAEAGLAAGADDYVTKPFSPKQLVVRLAELLGTSARTSGRLAGSDPLGR